MLPSCTRHAWSHCSTHQPCAHACTGVYLWKWVDTHVHRGHKCGSTDTRLLPDMVYTNMYHKLAHEGVMSMRSAISGQLTQYCMMHGHGTCYLSQGTLARPTPKVMARHWPCYEHVPCMHTAQDDQAPEAPWQQANHETEYCHTKAR